MCWPKAASTLSRTGNIRERGPFKLFHADAFNVLTQIERDAGNHEAAVKAATKTYRLAWCDGPPFAYHWGLQKAKVHLAALGVPEPTLPPFDESKFEPMPEVEFDRWMKWKMNLRLNRDVDVLDARLLKR